MAIVSTQPEAVSEPTVAYDKLAVELSIVPRVQGNEMPALVNLIGRRYRTLSDGTIEFSPGEPVVLVYSDVFAAAQADADLAAALVSINTAIQTFVAAKGL
jgi:hypothetical protein